jgi:hypothetical protein
MNEIRCILCDKLFAERIRSTASEYMLHLGTEHRLNITDHCPCGDKSNRGARHIEGVTDRVMWTWEEARCVQDHLHEALHGVKR